MRLHLLHGGQPPALRPSGRRTFQCDSAGEQDIVLEMNVLMQVLLEFAQSRIETVVGWAGADRWSEIMAQFAKLGHQRSCRIVLTGHHRNGIGNGPEASFRSRLVLMDGFLKT